MIFQIAEFTAFFLFIIGDVAVGDVGQCFVGSCTCEAFISSYEQPFQGALINFSNANFEEKNEQERKGHSSRAVSEQ